MRHYLLLIFLVCSTSIKAQFSPIVKTDSVSWTLKHEVWDRATIESLYLKGSITLNSKIYYSAYIKDNTAGFNGLVGYFREDASTGKAWFLGINDTSEYLIMDLSLKVGDSILVKLYGKDKYAHINEVTIEHNRKVLITDYHLGGGFISENLKFIEGIGPNASLLYQLEQTTASKIDTKFGFLVCKAHNNNNLVYAWDPINLGCGNLWDNIISAIYKKDILIYPNPTSKMLKIASEENLDVSIFDKMGRLVLTTDKKEIDISDLSDGIYIVRLNYDGKVIKTVEIIKNNYK